jgi:hypothetical protein
MLPLCESGFHGVGQTGEAIRELLLTLCFSSAGILNFLPTRLFPPLHSPLSLSVLSLFILIHILKRT